jgi:hypothetical protein
MDNRKLAALLMLAGGLLLAFGGKLPFGQLTSNSVEGSIMVLVNEKTKATVTETLGVRKASELVTKYKMAGYRNVDKDDPWAKSVLEEASKKNLTPPVVGFVTLDGTAISKVRKVAPWKENLEDSIK